MDNKQLRQLATILDTYGADAQMDMMLEEETELAKALLKYRRAAKSETSTGDEMLKRRDAIIDEIADVKIMLHQMEILFGCAGEVESRVAHKIDRQMERIAMRNSRN